MKTYYLRKNETFFSLETYWGFAPKVKNREEGELLAQQLQSKCSRCQLCPGPLFFDYEKFNMLISRHGPPVPAKICPNLNTDTTVETV